MKGRTPTIVAVLAGLLGCVGDEAAPRPQALVLVDTDLMSPGAIDRVRMSVLREEGGELVLACDACTREVFVEAPGQWPISFGVEPSADGSTRWVRVVGFEDGRAIFGDVLAASAVEMLAELRFGDAVTPQLVFLSGDCFGRPVDLATRSTCNGGSMTDAAAAPDADPSAPSSQGTFMRSHARPCTDPGATDTGVFDEDVCIEGGTFWMGDIRRQGLSPIIDAVPEHLVTVGTFFLDRYEYTVGRYRAAVAAGFAPPTPPPDTGGCALGATPPEVADTLPLNCVDADTAQAACEWEGRRLPTEAEWEWAAGSRDQQNLYPWGHDRLAPPSTMDGPVPVTEPLLVTAWTDDDPPLPMTLETDATELDGIVDMGWNVQEWVADDYQLYTARCWRPGGYGPNPVCRAVEGDELLGRSIRGGYWNASPDLASIYRPMAVTRSNAPTLTYARQLGFRCARDGG